MLIDYEYVSGKLVVSYVASDGSLKIKHYDWKRPQTYQITDEFDPAASTKYKTWDGRKVKLQGTNKPNRYAVYEFLDALPKAEQDELFGYMEPSIFFCDIETEIVDTGFVEPVDATTKVLSIAIVHKSNAMILGIKPLHNNEQYWIQDEVNKRFEKMGHKYEVKYIDFSTYEKPEWEMMNYFFTQMVPRMPVITGWNFVNYDWTFLVNRCRRIGVDPNQASATRKLVKAFKTPEELPMHRIVVDYMDLFKKWDTSIKIRESFSLDFVAEKTLGGEGKVVYYGGLQTLYEQDYKNYLFYNVVDTILVQLIHEKMKYINIMYAIASLSRTRALDALSALRVTEGVMRNDFRDKKGIVLCKDYDQDDTEDTKVEGGYVQDPSIRGMNKWLVCYDFASLYPTTQRQNNIAPENFKGVKIGNGFADFNGRRIQILDDDITCINGAVFNRDFSVTCNKLTEIYNDRKKYKKKMLQAKDEVKKIQKEIAELEAMIL